MVGRSGSGGYGGALRRCGAALLLASLLVTLVCAAMIPFYYQSQTILYKFGLDKTMLRFGKIVGLWAACLLISQIITAARFKSIEVVVGKKRLVQFHQLSGAAIPTLALLHPLLVFWPEDLRVLVVTYQFWPEIAGAFLLLFLWLIYLTAKLRTFLKLSAPLWLRLHRVCVHLAVAGMVVHTLYVSDTFSHAAPRVALLSAALGYLLVWLRLRLILFRQRLRKRRGRGNHGKAAR